MSEEVGRDNGQGPHLRLLSPTQSLLCPTATAPHILRALPWARLSSGCRVLEGQVVLHTGDGAGGRPGQRALPLTQYRSAKGLE